jgi:predicted nucleic acid-binding protein
MPTDIFHHFVYHHANIWDAELQELNADLLLLDDMKARRTATERGLAITGILGILDQAATMKLIDLPAAVQNLQSTSFWASDSLFQKLLDKHL